MAVIPSVHKPLHKGHMRKVLQVTPTLNAGGVERTTLEIADAISRAGGLALVASAGGRLESDLGAAGGELVRLPVSSKNPLTLWRNAGRLARLAAARGVNLIHARSRAPAWSALIAARRLKLPFVTTYHGVYNARTAPKRFYNSVMARGDLVIANSEFTRAHVMATYGTAPERVIAIPRGVDVQAFDAEKFDAAAIAQTRAAWDAESDSNQLVIILPARLTRWKGQLVLIDAVARLDSRRPGSVQVIFAGDAQGRTRYVAELKSAIEVAGLGERARIVGHVDNIAAALAASDVVVLPSIEPEAFGRGAIEAQAMSRPVIAAAHGGLAETIVDGATGLLVPPGDAEALAGALERLIDMGPQARRDMGRRGRERVVANYTTAAMQAATLAVYDRLLGAEA
jgi:glycosyltransferase involved in cell wall biosynthesis